MPHPAFAESSIYGVNRICNGKPWEKAAWAALLVAGCAFSALMIRSSFEEWAANPVMTTIETTEQPIQELHFPTVTVCSREDPDLFEFTKILLDMVQFSRCPWDQPDCDNYTVAAREDQTIIRDVVLPVLTEDVDFSITPPIDFRYVDGKNMLYSLVHLVSMFDNNKDVKEELDGMIVSNLVATLVPLETRGQAVDRLYRRYVTAAVRFDLTVCQKNDSCLATLILAYQYHVMIRTVAGSSRPFGQYMTFFYKSLAKVTEDASDYAFTNWRRLNKGELRLSEVLSKRAVATNLLDVPVLLFDRKVFDFTGASDYYDARATCAAAEMRDHAKRWKSYTYSNESGHPCDDRRPSPCCGATRDIPGMFADVMLIMKNSHFHVAPHSASELAALLRWRSTFPYPKLPPDQIVAETETWSKYLVPYCGYSGRVGPCDSIRPMFTTEGVCATYNARSVRELFADSPYMKIADELYGAPDDAEVSTSGGVGKRNGFSLALNTNNSPLKISVGVGNSDDAFNNLQRGLEVDKRQELTLTISAARIYSSDSLKAMSVDKRKCRFPDENELSLFKSYSQSACQYECLVNCSRAYCRCTPWNYPQAGAISEVCDTFGAACFRQRMSDCDYAVCRCEKDCNKTTFTAKESVRTVARDEYCENVEGSQERSLCSELDQLAFVRIVMESSTFPVLRQEERTNFSAQLATLGGTLGLFTGMSLLSFFELPVYFIEVVISFVANKVVRRG